MSLGSGFGTAKYYHSPCSSAKKYSAHSHPFHSSNDSHLEIGRATKYNH
jgi:hypothetical protein